MFFAASFLVFVLAKTFLHAPPRSNWWLGIKFTRLPIFWGVTAPSLLSYVHIYGDDNDDIAALVMRNKAIQVDTKPAGRTESVAMIWWYLPALTIFIFTFSEALKTWILSLQYCYGNVMSKETLWSQSFMWRENTGRLKIWYWGL